jgi:hypothetical protein
VYAALTLAEPDEVPVKVALQLAVPTVVPTWARVQGEPVNPPAAVPVNVNATEPEGVETVPALVAGSTTVAVQTEPWPTRTVPGAHDTVVVVGRRLTVTVTAALVLVA